MRYTRVHTWIALNDRRREGHWVNHGKRARWTYWGRGEPNNWRNEDCTLMNWARHGRWNDMRCSYRAKFACKKTKRAPRRHRHHGATFANQSFLHNIHAFKQAQVRRQIKAIAHHKWTWKMMRAALSARLRATHY